MFEIPSHKKVDPIYNCYCYMQSICNGLLWKDILQQFICERIGFQSYL